jgi:hypothetical protein
MRQLGALTALDRITGKIRWRIPMPELPGVWANGFFAAATISDDRLFIGGLDGTFYAFPVDAPAPATR